MHQLTSRTAYSLRVELQDWDGQLVYAQYERFQLASEGQLYRWVWGLGWQEGWGSRACGSEVCILGQSLGVPVPTICPPLWHTSQALEATALHLALPSQWVGSGCC